MRISGNEAVGVVRKGRRLVRRCGGVRVVVGEMYTLSCGEMPAVDRRRVLCHLQQIAMYVCHVGLRLPLSDIAVAYGRDRSTVAHACKVIEDRRDNRAYDEFISAVERVVAALFGPLPEDRHGVR